MGLPSEGFPRDDGIERQYRAPLSRKQKVEVTTIAPNALRPGASGLVEVVFHVEGFEIEARPGHRIDREKASVFLKNGAQLAVRLLPMEEGIFAIDEAEARCTWSPPAQTLPFLVRAHDEAREGSHFLKVEVWCEKVRLAHLYVEVTVAAAASAAPERRRAPSRQIPATAFASYAREDRARVGARLDSLKAVGIGVFMDCLDIQPAERWQEVLERELLERDALLLFWSSAASRSEWVEREWRFCLERRGDGHIVPNALEPPSRCPPPRELSHLQFGSVLTELVDYWSQ